MMFNTTMHSIFRIVIRDANADGGTPTWTDIKFYDAHVAFAGEVTTFSPNSDHERPEVFMRDERAASKIVDVRKAVDACWRLMFAFAHGPHNAEAEDIHAAVRMAVEAFGDNIRDYLGDEAAEDPR